MKPRFYTDMNGLITKFWWQVGYLHSLKVNYLFISLVAIKEERLALW